MAQTENLDNRLLNQDQEGGTAGELREGKRSSAADSSDSEQSGSGEEAEGQTLRQRVQSARQAINLKKLAKKKLEEKVLAPAKLGLNELLKQAWINLLDSFGLTLIWINLHVFLRWSVSDKLFCALGEEWLPKQVTQMGGPGGDAAKTASKGFGLIEIVVLLILDLIILCVILGVLAIIVIIVNFMSESWWDKFKDIWKVFKEMGWGGISALVSLLGNIKLK